MKQRIDLLQRRPFYVRDHRGVRRTVLPLSRIGTIIFIFAIIVVNYFVFFRSSEADVPPPIEKKIQRTEETKPQNDPTHKEPQPGVPEELRSVPEQSFAARLKPGERVVDALLALGLDSNEAMRIIRAMQSVFDFRKAKVGDRISIAVNEAGRVNEFEFHASPVDIYEVKRDAEEYTAVKKNVPVTTEAFQVGCSVQGSFQRSLVRCGVNPQLSALLVELFSWDVDFFTDVRDGDEVRAVIEKVFVEGKFLKFGDVLAAEYAGKFTNSLVVHYTAPDGTAGYFTAEGQSVERQFLRSPLQYTRVSSGFSNNRLHPVLHTWKEHHAVDYAAPVGTPVWAIAAGTVTQVGRKGTAGNLVRIQHDNGFESVYAHLDHFAPEIQKGTRIDQKQILGFVGLTGRTTGPHLHFAMAHKGRAINPTTLKSRNLTTVPESQLQHFRTIVDDALKQLRGIEIVPVQDSNT